MSEDATLDQEGAPGMDALIEGQEPATTTIPDEGASADAALEETGPGQAAEPPKNKRELAIETITANRLREPRDGDRQESPGTGRCRAR